jgi:Transposase DDE domain
MSIETVTSAILRQIVGISLPQHKFFVHLVGLILCLRGRLNYLNMARYGSYCEQSYRQHFSRTFDFKAFNRDLIQTHCGQELAWIFDPSYIAKSGKQTPQVGYFWSGSAGRPKWGLELGALAVADMDNHTAFHYHATQTAVLKGEESLLTYYANGIISQKEDLLKISKCILFDAFFSKFSFVTAICEAGLTMMSRLQKNIYLRYRYEGEQKPKGRRKEYGEKIDLKNPCLEHFKLIKTDDEERVYEGEAHVRCLKRWCKIVIVHVIKEGKVNKALVYFSTDLDTDPLTIYRYYKMRYQIEFLFRDAKGFLGLEHTQSRQESALEFHFNAVLTTLNLAKVEHWLSIEKKQRPPFSIADIKTRYSNQFILDKIISIYGKDPKVEIMNPQIKELYQLGCIAA